MIKLAPYQKSVIIGLLLSDGWLTFASKRSNYARLGFKQSLDRASYVLFVFNLLSHYCSSSPSVTTGIRAGKPFFGLQFLPDPFLALVSYIPSFILREKK